MITKNVRKHYFFTSISHCNSLIYNKKRECKNTPIFVIPLESWSVAYVFD